MPTEPSPDREPVKLSGVFKDLPIREQLRRRWTVACVGGETEQGFTDWLNDQGGSEPRPLHSPPIMNDNEDGVFRFYGTHSDLGGEMEVIPMTTGNVEFGVRDTASGAGLIFNLSHLDRIDLVRALLHDFHYSPERGGPDDQD